MGGEKRQVGEEDIGPHCGRKLKDVSLDVGEGRWMRGLTIQIPACAIIAVPAICQSWDLFAAMVA